MSEFSWAAAAALAFQLRTEQSPSLVTARGTLMLDFTEPTMQLPSTLLLFDKGDTGGLQRLYFPCIQPSNSQQQGQELGTVATTDQSWSLQDFHDD